MSMVEKFMLGETEIEIYDDCCCSEDDAENILREIEMLTKDYFRSKNQRQII